MRKHLALFLLFIVSSTAFAQAPSPDPTPPILSYEAAADRLLERAFALKARLEKLQADARIEGMSLEEVLRHPAPPENISAFRSRHQSELEIVLAPEDAKVWLMASQRFLKADRLEDSSAAVSRAYSLATTNTARAAAVDAMTTLALANDETAKARELAEYALTLEASPERQKHLDALIARLTLRITDVAMDVEARTPQACFVLSEALRKSHAGNAADYVRLEGQRDIAIRASGNRVCLSGLMFGETYTATLLQGLEGEEGSKLYKDEKRIFTVPDREPRIAVGSGTYVLPRVGDETVPLKTVNLSSVNLKLYRVSDRGLVPFLNAGLQDDNLYAWAEDKLGAEMGRVVWQGSVAVENTPNKDVTTLIPIREMIERSEPGIYALVTARPDEDETYRYRYSRSAQWLLISDLGLTTLTGDDGLHVFVHSLESAKALRSVTLKLVARDNSILQSAKTGRDGSVSFKAALMRGEGGASPAAIVAETDKGDYAFLSLTGPALDLSDRGASGRQSTGPLDGFLFSERGIYRPGEVVHLSAMLRDAQARAVPSLPLTMVVYRPDGVEAKKVPLTGDALGGYDYDYQLTPGARTGLWRAALHADDETKTIANYRFRVEDFVPERLSAKLETTADVVSQGEQLDAIVQADLLYGAPAADLSGSLSITLQADDTPFDDYDDYRFGLVSDDFTSKQAGRQSFVTDAKGAARVAVSLDSLPDTTRPLRAFLNAEIVDVGGRPVSQNTMVQVKTNPVLLGLKADNHGGFQDGETAKLDVIALSDSGDTLAGHKVRAVWVREHHQYNWYRLHGDWRFRTTSYDEVLGEEVFETGEDGSLELERLLPSGRYRLDVFEEDGNAATSMHITVGWWSQGSSPTVPDGLELTLDNAALEAGDRLQGFVKAPFEGRAIIAVVNDRLITHKTIDLGEDGGTFEFKVEADWGPSAYVLATALRPEAGAFSKLPVRATGLAWFSVDRAARVNALEINAPDVTLPGKPVELPIKVKGGMPGERMKVIIAAVDEGILNITRFKSPNPDDYYFAKRGFAMDVRDLYGRLIRTEEGNRGVLRSGGDGLVVTGMRALISEADEADNLFAALRRTTKTVALIKRDVELDETGTAVVRFDMPDFAGRLRLMAVAYGLNQVGLGEAAMKVRTPVVAELILPRFLAPGDKAQATLSVQNLSGGEVSITSALQVEGDAVALSGAPATFNLADGLRRDFPITLEGQTPGDAALSLALSGNGFEDINRNWEISVRAAWPYVTSRENKAVAPGDTVTISPSDMGEFFKLTARQNVTLASRPNLAADRLMRSLHDYAYRCSEQTASRAFPALYYDELAKIYDLPLSKSDAQSMVERAIITLTERQQSDGGFGVWHVHGGSNDWLDAYVTDFLLRAGQAGYTVPDAILSLSLDRLQRMVRNRGRGHLEATAYSLYVLARVGDVAASEVRYFADQFASKLRSPLAVAHVAASLRLVGEEGRADQFFKQASRMPRAEHYYSDYGTPERDRAAIAALIAEVAKTATNMAALADQLERDVAEKGWLSTQEMAWISRAAAAFSGPGETQLRASVGGVAVSAVSGLWTGEIGKDVPPGEISITNDGATELRLIRAIRGVPTKAPDAVSNGFEIARNYFDMSGKPVDPKAAKRNDRMVVLIEGRATVNAVRDSLIVDMLPAGFEIETTEVDSLDFLPTLSSTDFSDARDDRFVAAVQLGERTGWRKSRFRVAYIVRAITPGEFVLPGTFVEDMYQPQYHAQGEATRMEVRP
ncbi:alpha-2-macroglobulin family protein [Kordiimonas sp.]|uniref:alpha-2-macroglobulin family protein n=1 Tax=Kordiimonas sp. TaxID=1970157 RepID=UPI003A90E81E